MTTDITELAQQELAQLRAELSNQAIGSKDHLRKIALSLVDKLEKCRDREIRWLALSDKKSKIITDQEEALEKAQAKADVYDMLRDDYGLREKGVGLADFVDWQANRIADLESRTVKLPDDEDGQAYGFGKWANGKLPATAGTMTIAYCEDAWRAAFEAFSFAAGIKVKAE
ncbi:TPA: ead/Ea22-like family protein [Raoultella ornithinolytica]|uniref:Ead/Ea22-like family protein n=1 Tax=Raoultella ornithinolytica TaxID=54291 RepID=A0ABZ2DPX6_RAOOR|nr:ead/Ea22-like family protein [Raoultella ornithinolytica]HAT2341640.1 ead/Ea22-like family protein [Raoultella ornithinolytica]HAT2401386.1 ead/Ea22-like family protein [Raoultella ornithinolytica]HAT2437947.1 ead/Ea22-like family protein [Raoultella ornithinolytica]HAT2440035.1 ead/Ea22-like family protein [Raoultella ornithinolytica]